MNRPTYNSLIVVSLLAWCGVSVVVPCSAFAAVVETIDARTLEGDVVSLGKTDATLKTSQGETTIPTADVSRIVLNDAANPVDLLAMPGQAIVLTQLGDVLPARMSTLTMANNQFRIQPGEIGQAMDMPIEQAKVILLPLAEQTAGEILRRCEELQCTPGTSDILVIVRKDGGLQKVAGTLTGIAAGKIAFSYQGKERVVDGRKVCAIYLAKPAKLPSPAWGWLTTGDGCVYAFRGIELANGLYTIQRLHGPAMNFSPSEIVRITFRSDRLTNLADLKPTSVLEHSLFDKAIPYRVNRSAGGGAIQLAGRRYDTGLGLHSVCELKYDLGGAYRVFVATAGIDDAVRPNGCATLTILGDDKELSPAMTLEGKDAPQPIRLDVKGVKTLTIRVDLGPDQLDVSDHVDLAGAKLVK